MSDDGRRAVAAGVLTCFTLLVIVANWGWWALLASFVLMLMSMGWALNLAAVSLQSDDAPFRRFRLWGQTRRTR